MTQIIFKKERENKFVARLGKFGDIWDDVNLIVEFDENYNEWFFTLDLYIEHPINKDRWTQLYNVPYETKSECQIAALNMLEVITTLCKNTELRAIFSKEE